MLSRSLASKLILFSVTALSLPKLAEKWAFTPENFEDGYAIICDWYRDRRALTPIDLSQVQLTVSVNPNLLSHNEDGTFPDPMPSKTHLLRRRSTLPSSRSLRDREQHEVR